jgi:hypothetical protein
MEVRETKILFFTKYEEKALIKSFVDGFLETNFKRIVEQIQKKIDDEQNIKIRTNEIIKSSLFQPWFLDNLAERMIKKIEEVKK